MDTHIHTHTHRTHKKQNKKKAHENLKQDKQKHVKQDKKKKLRKTPVLTHFQRKEIKTQKESYVEGRKKIWVKKYLENFSFLLRKELKRVWRE